MKEDAASETVTLIGRDMKIRIDFQGHPTALWQFSSMLVLPPRPPAPPAGGEYDDNDSANHGASEDSRECHSAAASQIAADEEGDTEASLGAPEDWPECPSTEVSQIAAEEEEGHDGDVNRGPQERAWRKCHSAAGSQIAEEEEEEVDEANRKYGAGMGGSQAAEEEGDDGASQRPRGEKTWRECHSAAASQAAEEDDDDDEAPIGHPVRASCFAAG